MTELSFLIDLLLNHKLPKATRDAVAQRIKDVEMRLAIPLPVPAPLAPFRVTPHVPAVLANQSPSTQAALARHPDLLAQMGSPQDVSGAAGAPSPPPPPQPVAVIAQTPQAAAAMIDRNQAIAAAAKGMPAKGGPERPRKW